MDRNEIRAALEAADGPLPEAALRAAVEQAEQLSPRIAMLLDRAVAVRLLLPGEENLLFLGLHAMAAARRTELCAPFRRLLCGSEIILSRILGDDWPEIAGPLLLSLYDNDDAALRDILADPDRSSDLRSALFDVLTRLVLDGGADRAAFVDLLDRFDRETLAEPGEFVWIGWQEAVLALGLAGFTERVRRRWETAPVFGWGEVDQQDWLEQMQHASSGETPDVRACEIAPIDDPVQSLSWFDQRDSEPDDKDLSAREQNWLDWALLALAPTGAAMSLEEADGFFTGLLCGPRPATFADHEAAVWRNEPPDALFDRAELLETVRRLLHQRFETIAGRFSAGSEPELFLDSETDDLTGSLWATGFARAIGLDQDNWQKLRANRRGQDALAHIAMLCMDPDEFDEVLTPSARRASGIAGRRTGAAENWPQRSISLRVRQEVQDMLRCCRVSRSLVCTSGRARPETTRMLRGLA